jgi:hypothetical protein
MRFSIFLLLAMVFGLACSDVDDDGGAGTSSGAQDAPLPMDPSGDEANKNPGDGTDNESPDEGPGPENGEVGQEEGTLDGGFEEITEEEDAQADAGVPDESENDGGPNDEGAEIADAGVGVEEFLQVESCFDGSINDNLEGVLVTNGPAANGGVMCNENGALHLGDDQWAALGFAGTEGMWLKGEEVTSCLMIDLGKRCAVNDKIGISMSHRLAGEICGDAAATDQCGVQQLCGDMPGAAVHLYAADSLEDIRFVVSVGSCGQSGGWLSSASPLTALSTTDDLEAVRYLMACRPAGDCGAQDANIEIDSLFLTHRL